MLHPVGSHPSATYWRRRFTFIVLLILTPVTLYLVFSKDSGSPSPTSFHPGTSTTPRTPAATGTQLPSATSNVSGTPAQTTDSQASGSQTPSTTPAAPVLACVPGTLAITAGSQAPTYPVAAQPVLFLQVTNVGKVPCSTDLADPQIELVVYNGESRVWGSHDCAVSPGSSVETLAVNTPVARSITWSAMSSQPGCAGVRQHVQTGTYTLHAKLAGVEGTVITFSLT